MQENWIGRSEGAMLRFQVAENKEYFWVYTTRPDTVYGVSYMVLAPEHPLVERLIAGTEYEEKVRAFITKVQKLSEVDRSSSELRKRASISVPMRLIP